MTVRTFGAPSRYIQGPGALGELAPLIKRLGRRCPFVIVDAAVVASLGESVEQRLADVSQRVVFSNFSGECSVPAFDRTLEAVRSFEADIVIGLGGGKTIDLAKLVREAAGTALVTIPTIASNGAATSRVAFVHTEERSFAEVRPLSASADAVIVDTRIIAAAPPRLFIAGLGDAVAKTFEIEQCLAAGGHNFFDSPLMLAAGALAESAYRTTREYAPAALAALGRHQPDEAMERATEAIVLMGGLAVEGGAPSAIHALARALTSLPACRTAHYGEIVAFAVLVQLVLDGQRERFIEDLVGFYRRVGLPTRLWDLGIAKDKAAAIDAVARRACAEAAGFPGYQAPFEVESLAIALGSADGVGSP